MIASYAWSNMMIINLVNIKVNYFPSEEMDIFIRMTPGISRDIISLCRNIFSEVYYMETPRIQLKGFFHRKNLFKFLKDAILYNRQYNRLLENSIDNKVYEKVLVAGFWNDSLYYIDYFAKINPNIRILLFDEGGVSYDNPKKNLCRYYCNKDITRLKIRIKKFFPEKILELKHKNKVENKIFLYTPERYTAIDPKMEIIKIPNIDSLNPVVLNFFLEGLCRIQEDYLKPYRHKTIYFIAPGDSKWIPDADNQSEDILLFNMLSKINSKNILVKTHPNNTHNRKNFALKFENVVFIDRNETLLEAVFLDVNIEDKIIVTFSSSGAMFAKTIFGKEPYIVLTFRLFHQYHERGDENAERYAYDLKKMYTKSEKILIPNTVDEFCDMLKNALLDTFKY